LIATTIWIIQVPNPVPAKTINGKTYAIIVKEGIGYVLAEIPEKGPVKSQTFQYIEIPKDWKSDRVPWWIPPCRSLCGKAWIKRWHEACLWRCRIRLVLKGKYPALSAIKIFQLYRREGRPRRALKDVFLNLLWRICLKLAN